MKVLNEFQKDSFNRVAKEVAYEKKLDDYLPSDIVALGYYLIKNNIEQAEEIEKSLEGLDVLLKQAQELLGD